MLKPRRIKQLGYLDQIGKQQRDQRHLEGAHGSQRQRKEKEQQHRPQIVPNIQRVPHWQLILNQARRQTEGRDQEHDQQIDARISSGIQL